MPAPFRFAHLSDIHLPTHLADGINPALLANKRFFSWLSWFTNRRKIHKKIVTDTHVREILESALDHIVVTGDLINLSLPNEYVRAEKWLQSLGSPQTVTAIPGNHDFVLDTPATQKNMARFAPFMQADKITDTGPALSFPFTKTRNNIVFIGLSTAIQTPIGWCSGILGRQQLADLRTILKQAGQDNLCRIIALHHPPAEAHKPRGGLEDREEFAAIIAEFGAELILHGHTHRPTMHRLDGPKAPVPVMGIASLSVWPNMGHPAGCWNEYEVWHQDGSWKIALKVHRFTSPDTPSVIDSNILLPGS